MQEIWKTLTPSRTNTGARITVIKLLDSYIANFTKRVEKEEVLVSALEKLPSTEQTEIFVFRLSSKTKKQLEEFAKKNRYRDSCSAVLRSLICT